MSYILRATALIRSSNVVLGGPPASTGTACETAVVGKPTAFRPNHDRDRSQTHQVCHSLHAAEAIASRTRANRLRQRENRLRPPVTARRRATARDPAAPEDTRVRDRPDPADANPPRPTRSAVRRAGGSLHLGSRAMRQDFPRCDATRSRPGGPSELPGGINFRPGSSSEHSATAIFSPAFRRGLESA
jgi:hypothetical protein